MSNVNATIRYTFSNENLDLNISTFFLKQRNYIELINNEEEVQQIFHPFVTLNISQEIYRLIDQNNLPPLSAHYYHSLLFPSSF